MKNLKERILQQLADGLGDGEDYTEFIDIFFNTDDKDFEETLLYFTLSFAIEAIIIEKELSEGMKNESIS